MIDVRPGHKSVKERLVNINKCIDSYLLLKKVKASVDKRPFFPDVFELASHVSPLT